MFWEGSVMHPGVCVSNVWRVASCCEKKKIINYLLQQKLTLTRTRASQAEEGTRMGVEFEASFFVPSNAEKAP
jgi:hypothetical protein